MLANQIESIVADNIKVIQGNITLDPASFNMDQDLTHCLPGLLKVPENLL